MTGMKLVMGEPEILILGWAGLNFVWQGALLAVLFGLLLLVIKPRRAGLRYLLGLATLVVMSGLPVVSVWKGHLPATPVAPLSFGGIPVVPQPDRTPPQSQIAGAPTPEWRQVAYQRLERLLPWASALWILGALVLSFKTLGGLVRTRFLARNASVSDVEEWSSRIDSLAGRVGLDKDVRVLKSDGVSVPAVVGWIKPAILVPDGAAGGLPREAMDALLAHELAHIRRRDFLVNLLQTAVENLLFYHPAVWWVSSRVRQERECCCDDFAAAVCGDTLVYARALSRAERFRSESRLAVSAGSDFLLNRVRRMTEMTTTHSSPIAAFASGLSALALVLAAGAAFSALAHIPTRAARPSPRSSDQFAVLPDPQPDSRAHGGVAGEISHQYPRVITGKVGDPSGALVPGARIRVKDRNTGKELLTAVTDQEGGFAIELPSTEGIEVRIEHPGFRAAIYSGDLLKSGPLNVILRVGRISEVVTITSSGPAAQADSPPREPIRLHGGVVPPKLLHWVEPVYPAEARQQSVEGTIEIEALIDTNGGVKDARILKGHPLLDAAALKAVRQWRYTPGLMNGEPWPVEMGITLVFQLKQ